MGNLLGGGILLTVIVTCWDKVRGFLWNFLALFIAEFRFDNQLTKYGAVYAWDSLKNKKSMAPIYKTELFGSGANSRVLIRETGFANLRLVWFGKVPCLVTINKDFESSFYGIKPFINHETMIKTALQHYYDNYSKIEIEKEEDFKKQRSRFCTLYVRGSLNKPESSTDGTDGAGATGGDVFTSHSYIGFSESEQLDIGRRVNYTAEDYRQLTTFTKKDVSLMDNLYLTKQMNQVKDKLQRWFDNKDWFIDRSIQWKRGILLHGEPGTGKTSFISALAEHFRVPMYIFDLSTFTNDDLEKWWKKIRASTPCFVVFEDFDSVFDGRKNVHSEGAIMNKPVSFDCILNTLDGAVKYDGIVTFVTTNNMEKIDRAIGGGGYTRPGRIDYVFEMNGIDTGGKKFIAEKIFHDMDNKDELVFNALEAENVITPAQFKEHCINAALESYDKE